MLPPTTFPVYWAFSLGTLGAAFFVLMKMYRLAGSELELRGVGREFVFLAVTSLAQAAAAWFCAPFMTMRGLWAIAVGLAAIIFWLVHYPDWGGFESLGLALFQYILFVCILMMIGGAFGLACIMLALFVVGLAVIIGFGRSL